MKRARRAGFTLVELLVAGTIMLLILGALGNLFISSSRAYRVNDRVSDRQQLAEAATQLLTYEIGLAGYRGSDQSASARKFETAVLLGLVPVPESTLIITKGASATDPDTVTVRYYEDRFVSSTAKRTVAFTTAKDSDNAYNLYRTQDGDKKPAILGIKNLKVVKYIKKDGTETTTSVTKETLAALKLELTFTDEIKQQVVIGINNQQLDPSQQLDPVLPNL